jgi:hypothetical protein
VLPGRVVGKTCVSGAERGSEIDSWLKSVPFPVESFVILDLTMKYPKHTKRGPPFVFFVYFVVINI